jgi:hypothetical protein
VKGRRFVVEYAVQSAIAWIPRSAGDVIGIFCMLAVVFAAGFLCGKASRKGGQDREKV